MAGDFDIHMVGGYIKLPAMKEYLYRQTKSLWRKCVMAFIRTVAATLSPNVDTGMSLGSLIPLAKRVGLKNIVEAFIGGTRIRPNAYNVPGPRRQAQGKPSLADLEGRGDKSLAHGIQRGEKAYELSHGTYGNPEQYFSFTITVLQFYLHEHGLGIPSSPIWHAMEKGREAFYKCWYANYEKYFSKKLIADAIRTGIVPTWYEE